MGACVCLHVWVCVRVFRMLRVSCVCMHVNFLWACACACVCDGREHVDGVVHKELERVLPRPRPHDVREVEDVPDLRRGILVSSC